MNNEVLINKITQMEIQIEFGGFYGYHEEYINDRLHDFEIDDDSVDWNATFKDYAKNWLHRFNNMSNLELQFIGIDSPKFYNFRTDRIIAYVEKHDEVNLMKFINDDEFYHWANPQLKSRSGFYSFYNGIDDLIQRAQNDDDKAILLGMICNYLIELNEVNEDIYELEYNIFD